VAGAGTDRPFRGFNVAATELQNTYLRPSTNAPGAAVFTLATANSHYLFQSEPLRKMLNNFTTTSDTFLVIMTVGFFEVNGTNNGGTGYTQPRLSREIYNEIPGDLRQQFAAVVDRSQLTIKGLTSLADATTPADAAPWFTTTTQDIQPEYPTDASITPDPVEGKRGFTTITVAGIFSGGSVQVYSNGSAVTFARGDLIRVGFGDNAATLGWSTAGDNTDGEWVRVRRVVNAVTAPGTVKVVVHNPSWDPDSATPPTFPPFYRVHPAGSPVSNAILGNPGPQASFNLRDPKFRTLLPGGVVPLGKP
jgi:hypothetical protein